MANPLVWSEEYSVGVAHIDEQHKQLFSIINDLIRVIDSHPTKEAVDAILTRIVTYKAEHFATEEAYFTKFEYAGGPEHVLEHRKFTDTVTALKTKHGDDSIGFAFALVDYLEDWLLYHLQTYDRKYIACFHEHGLH